MYLSDSRAFVVDYADAAALTGAISDYLEKALPGNVSRYWNDRGVRASVKLADQVSASVSVDVDPVYGKPGQLRISLRMSVSGQAVKGTDQKEAKRFFDAVDAGISQTVDLHLQGRRPRNRPEPLRFHPGLGGRDLGDRGVA